MAVGATTGPVPALRVCTCVSVTLKGDVTVTFGAVVSVDPVTATLPVVPGTVHSGTAPFPGAAVGHVLAAGVGSEVATWLTEGVLADEADDDVVSDPHPARVRATEAAQAASTADEVIRQEFTVLHGTCL